MFPSQVRKSLDIIDAHKCKAMAIQDKSRWGKRGLGGNSVVDVVPVAALRYIFPDYQIDKNLRATGLAGSTLAELYMRCKFIDQVPPHETFHIALNNEAQ